MKSVKDVAKWFLHKESMTHKKLQKLCYYAQAWHCALLGKPLFTEEIQAWVHGPVCPELYHHYSNYKWNNIPKFNKEVPCFSEKTTHLLESVYVTYKDFSGDELETLTHSEKPWKKARAGLEPWESSTNVIELDIMAEYYRKKYEQEQND